MRRFLGVISIMIGLAIIFYPQIEKKLSDQKQQRLIDSFEQLGQTEVLEQLSAETEDIDTTNQEIVKALDGARGIIRIDSIDLEMMVFDGADIETLRKGGGVVEPKKEFGKNNVGIAAHRAIAKGKQFNRLDEVNPGDEIEIKTHNGTYEFVVSDTFVVHKSDVEVLKDQDKPLITLVTCTPLGQSNPPDRLIVQAELKQ